jgi:AraC-like DNA-binding protein/quercetin dioxygenase-like cupin family protein
MNELSAKKKIDTYVLNHDGVATNVRFHYKSTSYLAKHRHGYWEIPVMCAGETVHYVNGKQYKVGENELILIRPQDVHYFYGKDNTFNLLNVEIAESYFEAAVGLLGSRYTEQLNGTEGYVLTVPHYAVKDWNHEIFRAQMLQGWDNPDKKDILQRLAMRILIVVCGSLRTENKTHPLVDECIGLMRHPDNIDKRLNEIARIMNYNETYLMRLFKQCGLDTPNNVFKDIKLNYAASLLCETEFGVETVSEKIGYQSLCYFNKAFTQKYGLTPSKYGKIYKSGSIRQL